MEATILYSYVGLKVIPGLHSKLLWENKMMQHFVVASNVKYKIVRHAKNTKPLYNCKKNT